MSSGVKYNLAILASGNGSNADKICSYFKDHPEISVCLIISNRSNAGVLQIARNHNIESLTIRAAYWSERAYISYELQDRNITHIILACFLLLLPSWLVEDYNGRIINIHPALLPRHGGKGMFGMHVHQQVKLSGDTHTGITIHEVNEHYDDGKIIFQEKVEVLPDDTPSDIAHNVLEKEHYHYPREIERWILTSPIIYE
ncbi:MAG: phosphoribosylglycinamide formyltransferase [Saprospiraceae bacterium]